MKQDRDWIPGARDLEFIESASPPPGEVHLAMERLAEEARVPIVDRATGRVLAAMAAGRRRIVEVGTAIGYSTLWLAMGQPADGTIVTIDPDTARTGRARDWWREAGIGDGRITVVNAPALEAFDARHAALEGPFDLAFVDALKPEYGEYVEAIVPRLAPGALLLADNVLWTGRVSGARPAPDGDRDTEVLRAFDRSLLADSRFQATILPVGDGLLVAGYRG